MTARSAPAAPLGVPAPLERLLTARISVRWELVAYAVILAAAFALRFWDLGSRALHHDESIHAQWAWQLAHGDYTHSPVFHGPLYYVAQGFVFLVGGATDYTSRVSAALFGMALVALPLAMRRWLGQVGTLAAVAFIAFSPTLVYYSRFFREDIYFAVFTLLMVVAMWRYLESGRDRWLVVFAVALAAGYATKEAAYLSSAVFLLYLNGHLAFDLAAASLRRRRMDEPWRRALLAAALFPYAWALAALWPFLGRLRRAASWEALPRPGDVLIVLGTLTLPLLAAFAKDPLESGLPLFRDLPLLSAVPILGDGIVSAGRLDYPAVCQGALEDGFALGGVFAVVGAGAAFVGLQWRPRVWLVAAGLATLLYVTLFTSFFTNAEGLCTGPWGSLDYWRAQQDVRRGNQPWFYYTMLMPAYEFLPLALAVLGSWWAVVRGNAFSRFLVFWVVGFWIALSAAGEKMPWLNTHLALPTAILAGWTVHYALTRWRPQGGWARAALPLAGVALVAAGAMLLLVYDWGDGALVALVRVAVAAGALAVIVATARMLGTRSAGVVACAAIAGGLAVFSLQTMGQVVYERGDVPQDLLIYTQSAPDIPAIADDIDALAAATGEGHDLSILVDSHSSFAWPWVWYLRDYDAVRYVDTTDGLPQGEFDVMLVHNANVGTVNQQLAERGIDAFAAPERYPHRWWFPETYKAALPGGPGDPGTWETIADAVFDGGWLGTWFDFWRDHDAPQALGSEDGFAFFPANFDRATDRLSDVEVEPVGPGVDGAGRPVFGGLGSRDGQFFQPVDIEADAQGNLFVIDRITKKLQKFDADGNLIAAVDIRGDVNEDAEPWGLAVTADGGVIVADTFGWRVLGFDANLQPIGLRFGQPPDLESGQPPGPYDLFGPRDVAIDADGNLWVTDTGHHRVVVYSAAGEYVRELGGQGDGPGEFAEPVGIAIASDGTVFVADMWNSRVQLLDPDGAYVGEFTVDGWGGIDATDKPYLTVLADGRVALSLPTLGEVRVYERDGTLVATLAPADEPLRLPYGIVQAADGRLWITEGESARVRLFAIP